MSDTSIEWTDKVWNPLRGCSKVSEGCRNCYAIKTAHRFSGEGQPFEGLTEKTASGVNWTGKVMLVPDKLEDPIKWKKPAKIFVNSMSDLFHDDVPDYFIWNVFQVMARCPHHTFQILTKRPERMMKMLRNRYWRDFSDERALVIEGWHREGDMPFLPNVWLGVSVENQKAANERIPLLLQTPATIRFLSCEPLLGPVDLNEVPRPDNAYFMQRGERGCITDPKEPDDYVYWNKRDQIHWVIAGGESGPGARPMHPDWVRSLRNQCQDTGVPFHFKQWGEWSETSHNGIDDTKHMQVALIGLDGRDETNLPMTEYSDYNAIVYRFGKKANGRMLDGRTWDEFPEVQA